MNPSDAINPHLPQALRELLPTAGSLANVNPADGMIAVSALLRATTTAATWLCPDCGEQVPPKTIPPALAGQKLRYLPAGHCTCPGGLDRYAQSRIRWAMSDVEKSERSVRERLVAVCELDPAQTFESWLPDNLARVQARETARRITLRLNAGEWGLWWGPYGCGKTHLANAVAYSLVMDHGKPARVVNWLSRLREIQMEWKKKDGVDREALLWRPMLNSQVLFLDDFDKGLPKPEDLGKPNVKLPSNWYTESLYFVIDERYRANRPTVLISNQSLTDLTVVLKAIGGTAVDAVLSRFNRSGASSVDWGKLGLTEFATTVTEIPQF